MMQRLALFLPLLFLVWSPGAVRSQEPAGLLVRVVDGEGRPVAGATVQAGPEVEEDKETTADNRREETGAEGTVRFRDLPVDENVWLLIEKKGFFPAARVARLQAGAPQEIRVALLPGGFAVGRVVDEAGKPVAGVEVALSGAPFGIWAGDFPAFLREKEEIRTRTGPAGRFRFQDLPEGEFEMVLRHPSYAPLSAEQPVEGGRSGDLGRFVLRRGATLTGQVTDPGGRPLAGVSIWAFSDEITDGEEDFPPPRATTGPDGTFSIPHLPPGEPELHFCSPGTLPFWQSVPFPDEPVHVTLHPAALLSGRVLSPDGAPLAGASLYADQIGVSPGCSRVITPCGEPETAVTDAEGRFSVGPLLPGWYDVRANAPGLVEGVAEKVRAAAGEPVEGIEIRMEAGGTLAGRVLDAEGAAIAGATVMARSDRTSAQGTSAADGSYRLTGIDDGLLVVLAQAEGHRFLRQEIEPGAGARQADLVMAREDADRPGEVEVQGRVVGPAGEPIDGALVQAFGAQTWSAADGSFALEIIASEIWASKSGFALGRARVASDRGPILGIEIRLETGSVVSGRVLGLLPEDRGHGMIRLTQAGEPTFETSIAPDGTFRLEHVPSGTWSVQAQAGHRMAETSLSLSAQPNGSEAFVELELPQVHPVTGRVLDDLGQPVAGAALALVRDDFPRPQGSTRADGSFLLHLPDGEARIRLHREGFQSADLALRVDGGPVAGLEVRLEPATVLRGRILGLAPGDVPWVSIAGPDSVAADVGVDGGYVFSNLKPGVWEIDVRLSHSPEENVLRRTLEIPPGFREMVLDLELPAEAAAGDGKP